MFLDLHDSLFAPIKRFRIGCLKNQKLVTLKSSTGISNLQGLKSGKATVGASAIILGNTFERNFETTDLGFGYPGQSKNCAAFFLQNRIFRKKNTGHKIPHCAGKLHTILF